MTDNRIKVIENSDVKGLIIAAAPLSDDQKGGGQFEPDKQKEQIKKALAKRGIVEFTDKEIKTMPKTFKRLIIIQKKRCRMRIRQSGKNSTSYEIRFRRDGYDISASGVTIELAKANFIEKLQTAKPIAKRTGGGSMKIPATFNAFALYYFETFRKEKVTAKTYIIDSSRLKKYLQPHFGEKRIEKITPSDCKSLLDEVKAAGMSKTADELYSLMSVIFKGAIAHGILERNPLDTVLKTKHERESGTALTKDEETRLFDCLKGSVYETAAALALFCGLRPNELKTAKIQGLFIIAVNSKRKSRKIEYKRIPIIDKLRPFLPSDGAIRIPNIDNFRKELKGIIPGHRLYDLRTTFYTRCDELGVAPPARDHFVGHSGGVLTNTYRDLSDEYLLNEGEKLNKW
ncbi:MAG: hypothetical protein IJY62_01375 [Clostridia bacterium]|nr:hypothetical protein [Clostridia bacterium]